MMKKFHEIGVLVERGRAYGRRICEGIADYARECGDWDLRQMEISDLENGAIPNAFIARVTSARLGEMLKRTRKPVVDVYGALHVPGFAVVDSDHAAVGRMAGTHFLEHRFDNCAYCGYDGVPFSDMRRDAFRYFLELNHCHFSSYLTPEMARNDFNDKVLNNERLLLGPDSRKIRDWVRRLSKPIAVFCSHDLRAYQLAQICRKEGIDVPREVMILGVDNDPIVCGFSSPMISSIDPCAFEIGRMAARVLARMLEGDKVPEKTVGIKPVGVVARRSTEFYPFTPAWLSDALVFIRRNIAKRIMAADVYGYLGMSHTPVDRVFRNVLHTSVQKVIADVRMEEAKRLVVTTNLGIATVARQAGFQRSEYFCTKFREHYGSTPSEYRAKSHGLESS